MQNPSHPPPPGLPVRAILVGPVSATLTGNTGVDGIAAITYVVNDPYVGQPVTITVNVSYGGQQYQAQTFFTSGPGTANSPTPSASGTPGAPQATTTP